MRINLVKKDRIATIMFDDGYKDNIEYALPILEKYNYKASFYIVTDCIDQNIPTWTYNLERRFQFTNKKDINLNFSFLPSDLQISQLGSTTERIDYVRKLKPVLKKIPHTHQMEVLNRVAVTFDDVELPLLMMDWQDVMALKNAGHYIGSHTVSHDMLGNMTDEQEIAKQLTQSAAIIEARLGHFPLTISYPVGSFSPTVKRLAKEARYKIGLADYLTQ